jgi:hypothetical protein
MLILGGVWRRSREKKRGKSLDWVLCDLLTDKYPPNVHYLVFFIIIVEVILPNHPFNLVVYTTYGGVWISFCKKNTQFHVAVVVHSDRPIIIHDFFFFHTGFDPPKVSD